MDGSLSINVNIGESDCWRFGVFVVGKFEINRLAFSGGGIGEGEGGVGLVIFQLEAVAILDVRGVGHEFEGRKTLIRG